jgi:hypothetical protein
MMEIGFDLLWILLVALSVSNWQSIVQHEGNEGQRPVISGNFSFYCPFILVILVFVSSFRKVHNPICFRVSTCGMPAELQPRSFRRDPIR